MSAATGSRTVCWWPTHTFIADLLARFGFEDGAHLPYPGTAAWLELDDADPAKRAALLVAADHAVLRLETDQQARAQAAKDVAAEGGWSAVAQRIAQGRGGAYIPRRCEGVARW